MNMTNYEETKRTFALDVPFGFNFTRDVVDAWAKRVPSKMALVRVDTNGENREELTFTDISRLANRVGNAFQALGLQPGDRAFIMSHRIPQWWGLLCGMFKIGLVPMPATTLCTARDIEYRVNKADASALIVDVDGLAKAEEVRDKLPSVKHWICINSFESGWTALDDLLGRASDAEPAPRETKSSDPLLLYFTSGTVAYPKMVQHTHASYGFGHEITGRFWQDLVPTDSQFTISDTGWAKAAWGCLFPQWRLGASVFIWDQRGKMDPTLCLRVLEESGATVFCAPPTLYRAFAQRCMKPTCPRCGIRSAPASRSTLRSSRFGRTPPGRSSMMATGRRRPRTSSPTIRAWKFAQARWDGPARGWRWTSSTTAATAAVSARRASSACRSRHSAR
jgi:acyl-coenzyme A synthetase/AMP-(fatty) acid ligase